MSFPLVGLRPEQGPPLSVPLRFFFTAPLALAAAGGLLLLRGAEGSGSLWGPSALALTHLGTVGLLLFVMLGALYQMLPVVAGAVVPWARLSYLVHALLVTGSAALLWGQAGGPPGAFAAALGLLGSAVLLFLGPAAVGLARSQVRTATSLGMALALAALGPVVFAGLRLAWGRSGHPVAADWLGLRYAHAHLGFLCWVGGLIAAVSWQVLPMFFLAPMPPQALVRASQVGVALSLLGLTGAVVAGAPARAVPLLAAPGAAAVWLLQPGWALWALRQRKRKRKDATLWFWWLGLLAAPGCLALGAASAWLDSPAWPLLYGLLVLWGWAGAVVHGMLVRIVPFLVWLHHCAPRVGHGPVPTARELLPDRTVAVGFALHLGALAAGLAAVATQAPLAWRALGGLLLASGAWLLRAMLGALARGRVGPQAH